MRGFRLTNKEIAFLRRRTRKMIKPPPTNELTNYIQAMDMFGYDKVPKSQLASVVSILDFPAPKKYDPTPFHVSRFVGFINRKNR